MKYKLGELIKDLNVTKKEVTDLLKQHFGGSKSHNTTLADEELDVIFDYFTQKNELESFDAYFAEMSSQSTEEEKKEET